jgi:hypothetical protein
MVSFLQLDVSDEDSVAAIVSHIDDAIQYHEAQGVALGDVVGREGLECAGI